MLTLLLIRTVFAGSNEPIPDNQLGTYANSCANSFCKEKDGLELWLTLYQARDIEYIEQLWTPFEVANLCIMTAIAGFTFGFLIQKFVIEYYEKDE
jgi:hypothetical protein